MIMSSRRRRLVISLSNLCALILLNLSPSWGHMYSYCAGGMEFSFSSDVCPGGILLKRGTKIDKICQCKDTSLLLYDDCSPSAKPVSRVTDSSCDGLGAISQTTYNGQVLILIPTGPAVRSNGGGAHATCSVSHASCQGNSSSSSITTEQERSRVSLAAAKSSVIVPADVSAFEEPSLSSSSSQELESTTTRDSLTIQDGVIILKSFPASSPPSLSPESLTDKSSALVSDTDSSLDLSGAAAASAAGAKTILTYALTSNPKETVKEKRFINDKELESDEEPDSTVYLDLLDSSKDDTSSALPNVDPIAVEREAERRVELLRFVTSVKAGQIPDPPPVSKAFRMLKESMKIAGKIIPDLIIKDINLYEAYLGFSYLYQDIDEDIRTDRHLSTEDYRSIMLSLDLCLEYAIEIPFKTVGNLRQIKKMYLRNGTRFLEVDPLIPEDRAHKSESEDVIVGIMWKLVDIIHSACHDDFRRNSPSTQFDYVVSLEDIFLRTHVQSRWYHHTELYGEDNPHTSIISHPDMRVLMENLDRIDAAVHLTSEMKDFLRKPKLNSLANEPKNYLRGKDGKGRRRRLKRGIGSENNNDLKAHEIWYGQAYCLHLLDPNREPSPENIKPPLERLCSA